MVPVLLQELDDLPRHGAVAPGGVRITGEAEMYELVRDMLPVKLLTGLLDDVRARSDIGVELLTVTAQNVRNVAVKAPMRTACVDVECKLAVLTSCAFGFVYIEKAMMELATGCTVTETRVRTGAGGKTVEKIVKQLPPNQAAAEFLLINKASDRFARNPEVKKADGEGRLSEVLEAIRNVR